MNKKIKLSLLLSSLLVTSFTVNASEFSYNTVNFEDKDEDEMFLQYRPSDRVNIQGYEKDAAYTQELTLTDNRAGLKPNEPQALVSQRDLNILERFEWLRILHIENLSKLNKYRPTRKLPEGLSNLTKLKDFRIDHSNFSTPFPDNIGVLTSLKCLVVQVSKFQEGFFPSRIGQLTNLVRLDFLEHNFVGELPKELGKLTNLVKLSITYGDLEGPLPEELGNLRNLRYMNFSHNQFTGTIPDTFSQLENLERLYLEKTLLEDTKCIYEERKLIKGTVPDAVKNLPKLETIVVIPPKKYRNSK